MTNESKKDGRADQPLLREVPDLPPEPIKPTVVITNRLPLWAQVIAAVATGITALATSALVVATLLLFLGVRQEYEHYREEYADYKLQRQLNLMDNHLERFNSPLMLHARNSAAQSLGEGGPLQLLVFQFFERMGIQAREGLVTPKAVRDYFGTMPQFYWCGWTDWVEERREEKGDPEIWIEFENLNEGIAEVTGRKCISEAEIQEHAGYELVITHEYLSRLEQGTAALP